MFVEEALFYDFFLGIFNPPALRMKLLVVIKLF
jgi:hypothetical protein